MDREKLKVLKRKSAERLFSGKGGGLKILPERPQVVVRKDDQIVYEGKTVNYCLIRKAILGANAKGEFTVSEGGTSVKAILNTETGDVILSFRNKDGQGAIGLTPFKSMALLNIASQMANTISVHYEVFQTTEGKVKLTRAREKLLFPYGSVFVELPLPDRVLLELSLMHYLEEGELKPFLGVLAKAENKEGKSFVVLGIGDHRIPIEDKETAIALISIL